MIKTVRRGMILFQKLFQKLVFAQGVAAALQRTNVFPLLDQLWAARDADALLRRSVATTVAAMSVPGACPPLPIPL